MLHWTFPEIRCRIHYSVSHRNIRFTAQQTACCIPVTGPQLVLYPRGRAGAFVIPDGVTVLCDGAFRTCHGLTGVVIPEHVTVSMRQTIDALQ